MNLPYVVGEDEVREPQLAVYYILEDLLNKYFHLTTEQSNKLSGKVTDIFKKYMDHEPAVSQTKEVTEAAIQWAILEYLNMPVQVVEDINPYQKEVKDAILAHRVKIDIHSEWFKTL